MSLQLVHSQLSATGKAKRPVVKRASFAQRHRFKAFKDEVKKHEADIKEIQEYIPGWRPKYSS